MIGDGLACLGHIQQDPCMGHALIDVETGKASEYCMGRVVDGLHSRGGMHLKSSADEGLNSLIEDAENIVAL